MPAAISNIGFSLPDVQSNDRVQRQPDPALEKLMATRSAASAAPALVAPVRTRLDGTQAADALRAAWTKVTGQPPSENTVAILTAQWAHETGNGGSMYNYNFGGIKGASPEGLSVSQKASMAIATGCGLRLAASSSMVTAGLAAAGRRMDVSHASA